MAEKTKTNEAKISIKLIVDKVNKKVLYAEADHCFVDILFSFITWPLGTIVRLLEKHDDKKLDALASLNNLYQSLKDIPDSYLATEECKFLLLNPRSLAYDHYRNLKLKLDDAEPIKYFTSPCRCTFFYSTTSASPCTGCNRMMNISRTPDTNIAVGGGVFVSDIAKFIVTDDLSVMPYTSAGSIQLLTDFGITDMSRLEGRNIEMGRQQMLYILKMALVLDSPLTRLVFGSSKRVRDLSTDCQGMAFDPRKLIKKETSASSKMVVEVSLQKSTGKVLFAEANEDFVEFLFGLLSIPLGTVVGTLMKGNSSLTCMDNIFRSISNMSVERYLRCEYIKDLLLKPHFGQHYTSKNLLFPLEGTTVKFVPSSNLFKLKDPRIKEQFLKHSGMFFVTDDLVVTPSSSYSTMDTLNKFKVQLHDIERYEVNIGMEEGLRILKASLRSRLTLTNIIEHLQKK